MNETESPLVESPVVPGSLQIASKKYGNYPDESIVLCEELFEKLKGILPPDVTVGTDCYAHYTRLVKHHYPGSRHL